MNQCSIRKFADGARECRTCGAFASPGTTLLCRQNAQLVVAPGAVQPAPQPQEQTA